MAILRMKDIRNMKNEELIEKLKVYKEELMKLRMQTKMKRPIKNTSRIRELKKTIARILTVLKERNIQIK